VPKNNEQRLYFSLIRSGLRLRISDFELNALPVYDETACFGIRADSAIVNAPVGQACTHFPQSVHFDASTAGAS